jgi:putative transposase
MKFALIAKHRVVWPVAWMCAALGVTRFGFHAWLTWQPGQRTRDDEAIVSKAHASFVASDHTYGARRVWRDVLTEGVSCGLHRIERIMRENASRARPRRRGLRRTKVSEPLPRPISWSGGSRPTLQTESGSPTSPLFGPPRAGSTLPPSSICSRAAS